MKAGSMNINRIGNHQVSRRILVALTAGVLALLPLSATAFAEPGAPTLPYTCVEQVVDETDAHVLDRAAVTQAVAQLEDSTGASVYVHAYQHTPEGSAAAWWKKMLAQCPSLSSSDGKNPSPNIVVIEFGLDRTSAIGYGANWTATLDRTADNIRAHELNQGLISGRYTKAITDTLTALDTAMHGTDPYAIDVDWSGVGHVVAIVGMLVMGGGVLFALGRLLVFGMVKLNTAQRNRIKERRAFVAAQSALSSAKAAASKLVTNTDPDQFRDRVSIQIPMLPAGLAQGFQKHFDSAVQEIMLGSSTYAELNMLPDPDTTAEINDRAQEFDKVRAGISTAVQQIDTLITDMDEAVDRRTHTRVSADMESLRDAYTKAMSGVREVSHKGYSVKDLELKLESLRRETDTAAKESGEEQRKHIDDLMSQMSFQTNAVNTQMDRANELKSAGVTLRADIASARSVVVGARSDNAVVKKQSRALNRISGDVDAFIRKGDPSLDSRWGQFTDLRNRIESVRELIINEDRRLKDRDAEKAEAERAAKRAAKKAEEDRMNSSGSTSTGVIIGSSIPSTNHHSSSTSYTGGGSFGSFGGGFGGGGFSGGGW